MTDDPFKGKEYQAIMPRSAMTNLFFRLSFTCLTHLGALFAITYAQDRFFCLYTRIPFSLRICILLLAFAAIQVQEIADGATVVANSLHVGCDNSTCLLQRIDSRAEGYLMLISSGTNTRFSTFAAEYQAVMRRSAPAIMFFQVCFVFITVLGGLLAIMCAYYQTSSQYRTQLLSICIVLVTAASFVGGSTLYVKLLKWLLQCLQTREDNHWFVALAVMTLCDTFLDRDNILPLAFLSALSMIMICVLTTGWDSDRTGMTEGLLIGFGEWLLIYMVNSKLLQAVICGLVLLFVVVSKLTEHADGANVGNSLRAGSNASARYTAID